METLEKRREAMVEWQIAARGVDDPAVLEAMREVPREGFVAGSMAEFAYEDSALPIEEGQTISQPYIVALMAQALELEPGDRVLDVGTGSGYAAAVLSRIAGRVYSVERHAALAARARGRFEALGYDNVRVRVGDGTLGWEAHAPYDAIQVAAAGPDIPRALLRQLAPGGRLVIPTGEADGDHALRRVVRTETGFEEEELGPVRFVPLVGAGAWAPDPGGDEDGPGVARRAAGAVSVPERIRAAAEPFDDVESAGLADLLERIGDRRVVLLGESTHGTSEFYRMRDRITRALVEEKGFRIVALEADWPDAARLDDVVRGADPGPDAGEAFTRFPRWMWANEEVVELLRWMRAWNEGRPEDDRAGVHGLDLYSLHTSLDAVVRYLDDVDPEAARVARDRYACLTPWASDPAAYGRAVLSGSYEGCEAAVLAQLTDMLERRLPPDAGDARRAFRAERNARLVAEAERYYRVMYYGGRESWNLRDSHMFETLEALLDFHGPDARAVVWAHNSHVGDAAATGMGARGEHNIGRLCRERFGDEAYLVGFGTHGGTVAAAHDWGAPVEIMDVRPSHPSSYERLCHDAELDRFFLPLGPHGRQKLREALLPERLERAIGVVYRPATERASHYFPAVLPGQFDEWIWFDRTRAVTPLDRGGAPGERAPDTFPFGV